MTKENIQHWLGKFKKGWISHDVEAVLALFDNNVEYWETPQRRLKDFNELRKEWMAVKGQSNIKLDFDVFSSSKGRYVVIWKLTYSDGSGDGKNCAGTYLIKLNPKGLCTYFLQSS